MSKKPRKTPRNPLIPHTALKHRPKTDRLIKERYSRKKAVKSPELLEKEDKLRKHLISMGIDLDKLTFHEKRKLPKEIKPHKFWPGGDITPYALKSGAEINPQKLTDPEEQLEAYMHYCDHVAKGLSKRSWYYRCKDGRYVLYEKMERIIAESRGRLDPEFLQAALASAAEHWEEFVQDSAKMKVKHDTGALQLFMRNRFGWDRQESRGEDVKAQATILIEQLKALPSKDDTIEAKVTPIEKESAIPPPTPLDILKEKIE